MHTIVHHAEVAKELLICVSKTTKRYILQYPVAVDSKSRNSYSHLFLLQLFRYK